MAIDLSTAKRVSLTVQKSLIPRFFQLLGQGVFLEVQTGCSLKDLLCAQLGIPPDYLKNRIQTIFLNFKPVDSPDNAVVGSDATIALSAAMPGLAGALMRMGGHYAALRQSISYGPSAECPAAALGTVRLKLFNLVAAELGPIFLSRGVGVMGKDFQDFIVRNADALTKGCLEAKIGSRTVDVKSVLQTDWGEKVLLLKLVAATDT